MVPVLDYCNITAINNCLNNDTYCQTKQLRTILSNNNSNKILRESKVTEM